MLKLYVFLIIIALIVYKMHDLSTNLHNPKSRKNYLQCNQEECGSHSLAHFNSFGA
jgi:hypothetical protein